MNITGWKKNLLITIVFVVYLLLGSAIFYGIENEIPPPPPSKLEMMMIKMVSEKQMKGIQDGMTAAVPKITQMYQGQTGKDTLDDKDVSTIVSMSLEQVFKHIRAEMAKMAGGQQGPPHASHHSANGHDDPKTNGENEATPEYKNVEEDETKPTDEKATDDKTMTGDETTADETQENTRRKRQADNTTETATTTEATTGAPTTTTEPAEEDPMDHKPGFGGFVYMMMCGFSTIGFGNIVPETAGGQAFFMIYATAGIPLFFYVICKIVLGMRAAVIFMHTKILTALKKEAASTVCKNVTRLLFAFILGFVVLMLMCAAIFSHVEGWTYMQSLYFTYTTITTIGYGDYYPGLMMGLGNPMEVNSSLRGFYMVFVFVYMFVGISWFFTLGMLILDCCKTGHKTKEITKNGTSPKITIDNDVEKNEDLEKTATPLLNDSVKEEREMEEISINKDEEKPTENGIEKDAENA